jgi:hypothetical protein
MKILPYIGAGVVSVASVLAYDPTYKPADMPNIATDLLGSAGYEFKTYMPLIILGFVVSGLVTTWFLVKSRF